MLDAAARERVPTTETIAKAEQEREAHEIATAEESGVRCAQTEPVKSGIHRTGKKTGNGSGLEMQEFDLADLHPAPFLGPVHEGARDERLAYYDIQVGF